MYAIVWCSFVSLVISIWLNCLYIVIASYRIIMLSRLRNEFVALRWRGFESLKTWRFL